MRFPKLNTTTGSCRISEYDGAYKCWTHNRTWGAVSNPDEPCDEPIKCVSCEPTVRNLWKRIADLETELVDAGELHLADEQTVRNVEARVGRLKELLKRCEWGNTVWNAAEDECDKCPVCRNTRECGHAKDCKLAAELKEP